MAEADCDYRVFSYTEPAGYDMVTVLGPDGVVEPIGHFLGFYSLLDHSINTLDGYARDLCQFFRWLKLKKLRWESIDVDQLANFVEWLRFEDQLTGPQLVINISPTRLRKESTIRRKLSSVYSFYDFHRDTKLSTQLMNYQTRKAIRGRGRVRPVSAGQDPQGQLPSALTREQRQVLLDACDTQRDRLLLLFLAFRGLRVGQALGLHLSDIDSRLRLYTIYPRKDNINGARAKTKGIHTLPLTREMVRVYREYLYDEFQGADCDYVFINLHGPHKGQPMTYDGVRSFKERLVRKTGIEFHPHELRHTFATIAISDGVPISVVQAMLTHQDSSTTTGVYVHMKAETMRKHLDPDDLDPDDLSHEQHKGPGANLNVDNLTPALISELLDGVRG